MPEKMAIVAIGGQSQAAGFGLVNEALPVPNTVWQYDPGGAGWNYGNEPIAPSGAAGPCSEFASAFHNETGLRVCLVQCAVNGGFQTKALWQYAGSTGEHWDVDGTRVPLLISRANATKAWAIGAGFDARIVGVLWWQGTSEANAVSQGIIPLSTYKTALVTMINRYYDDLGCMTFGVREGMPALWNAGIAHEANGYSKIRLAQEEVAAEYPDRFFIASRLALQCAQRGLMMPDGVHPNQTANNLIGRDAGTRVGRSGLWNVW